MGLTPHEYYCMSPLEFHYAAQGYMDKYWKEWDRTRHIMYTIAGTARSKKKLPKISKWMPLPIDRMSEGVSNERAIHIFDVLKKNMQQDGKRTTS